MVLATKEQFMISKKYSRILSFHYKNNIIYDCIVNLWKDDLKKAIN
jgi:hypothetical protein